MPQFRHFPQHVQALVEAALAAAEPSAAVRRVVTRREGRLCIGTHELDLVEGRVFLVSTGKAAIPMALAAAEQLGPLLTRGVVISKVGASAEQQAAADNFTFYVGDHPVPSADSISATEQVMALLAETEPEDLVIFLISGGTSALLTYPRVSLADWQQLTDALLSSGCTINEFNLVRRQLDVVKGGGLARLAAPAKRISLILSDVVGNPLPDIGSGPTVPVDETPADALAVLARYDIASRLEPDVWQRIETALHTSEPTAERVPPDVHQPESAPTAADTAVEMGAEAHTEANAEPNAEVAADSPVLTEENLETATEATTGVITSEGSDSETAPVVAADNLHLIIGDVRRSALAAMAKAMQMGFVSQLLTARLEGEAREVARVVAALAQDAPRERCLILGGETTVTLRGDGRGGRNQELALSAALALEGWPGLVVASFATDGEDGPTPAAGAVVTGETAAVARSYDLDPQSYLDRNDSNTFFANLDEQNSEGPATLLETGSTGTNVNDLVFILTYPQPSRGFAPSPIPESEEGEETPE